MFIKSYKEGMDLRGLAWLIINTYKDDDLKKLIECIEGNPELFDNIDDLWWLIVNG